MEEIILWKSNNEGAWPGESEPFVKAYPSHIKMVKVIWLLPSIKFNIFLLSWFDRTVGRFDERMKQYQRKEQWHDKCRFCCHHKVYKGRSRLIPIWLIPPTETPLPWSSFMPLGSLPLHLFAGANHTKQFTAVPKYDAVFSLCDIRPVSRHRIPSQHQPECICGPTSSSDSDWPTNFSAIFICTRHPNLPTIVTTRGSWINGYERRPLWSSWLWLILVSGWRVITLAVTQDRHRDPDTGDCEEPTLSDGDNPEEI